MGVMKKMHILGSASFVVGISLAPGIRAADAQPPPAAPSPLLLTSIPAGQVIPDPMPTPSFEAPFQEGEDLLFRIRWGAVTGGYSSLSVKDIAQVAGRPAYHIVSEAHSTGFVDTFYHVEDRNEAWLDTQWPRSLRYEKKIREGKYRVHEVVTLDQTTHRFHEQEYRLDKNTFEEKEGQIPANVLDVLGSLYYLRSLPLEVGKSYTIDVHSGDKTWPLLVGVKKRKRIKVK